MSIDDSKIKFSPEFYNKKYEYDQKYGRSCFDDRSWQALHIEEKKPSTLQERYIDTVLVGSKYRDKDITLPKQEREDPLKDFKEIYDNVFISKLNDKLKLQWYIDDCIPDNICFIYDRQKQEFK